jgi:hypothetical protein
MNKLVLHLRATAELFGKTLSPEAAQIFMEDIAVYPEDKLLAALSKCRKELGRFPTIADIITRIPGGHPGAEEAWAMLPRDESDSVVWTLEMQFAYGQVRSIMDDEFAARRAFVEIYAKEVSESLAQGRQPVWQPSLGFNKANHTRVLNQAVEMGRITHEHAQRLLPDLTKPKVSFAQITGIVEQTVDPAEQAARIREALQS